MHSLIYEMLLLYDQFVVLPQLFAEHHSVRWLDAVVVPPYGGTHNKAILDIEANRLCIDRVHMQIG